MQHSDVAPLHGVRVLDLTRVLAGPYGTMLLADLGAEVVKVERPEGDDARQFGPFISTGESAYFASINRGKKSITLDLKSPNDRATFWQLAAKADVVVENYRPGTMEHFGLGSAALRAKYPRLIYASATGFGRTGPDAARAAYDVIVQARSGLMSITGHSADAPARVGSSISDILAGIYLALGVVAALRQRDQTGVGCDVDLSMLDCTVSTLENAIARFATSGEVPRPLGTRHPSIAPFQSFRAADGPLVIAAGNDHLWQKLCAVIEAPQLIDDPRLNSNPQRAKHLEYLEEQLTARLSQRSVKVWLALFDEAGVPAAAIHDIGQVVADPQLTERGMWHLLQQGDHAPLITAGTPFVFDGAKPTLGHTWPKLGEHTADVLRQWLGES